MLAARRGPLRQLLHADPRRLVRLRPLLHRPPAPGPAHLRRQVAERAPRGRSPAGSTPLLPDLELLNLKSQAANRPRGPRGLRLARRRLRPGYAAVVLALAIVHLLPPRPELAPPALTGATVPSFGFVLRLPGELLHPVAELPEGQARAWRRRPSSRRRPRSARDRTARARSAPGTPPPRSPSGSGPSGESACAAGAPQHCRQRVDGHLVAVRERHRALDQVFQLADVAREPVLGRAGASRPRRGAAAARPCSAAKRRRK